MRARAIIAAFIVAIGCAVQANAQVLAVKAGINVSNITQDATFLPDDELVTSPGFMVGAQIRRALNRVVQLQIEGLFTQKGNSFENQSGDLHDVLVINYLEVPVLARVGVMQWGENAVSIHGGPVFSLKAGSRETNNDHGVPRQLMLKTFDLGLAIGGQIEMKKLIIGTRYTVGLSNIFADDPALFGFSEMKNRTFTVFAGYRLR